VAHDRDQDRSCKHEHSHQRPAGSKAWDGTLSYSFATAAQETYFAKNWIYGAGSTGTFNPLLAATGQEAVYRQDISDAIAALSRVCGVDIKAGSGTGTADLLIAGSNNFKNDGNEYYALSTYPGTDAKPGGGYQAFLGVETASTHTMWKLNDELAGQSLRGMVMVHEIAHALGLSHPHDSGNGATPWTIGAATGKGDNPLDNERYTIMSYEWGGLDQQTDRSFGHAFTPMALDIAALQHLYGKNNDTNESWTTYALTDAKTVAADLKGGDGGVSIGRGWYCIWDTGGTDTIKYGGDKRVLLNLNDASLSTTDDAGTLAWLEQVKATAAFAALPGGLKTDIQNANYHAGGFFSRTFDADGIQFGG
jgi:hypothetical protein